MDEFQLGDVVVYVESVDCDGFEHLATSGRLATAIGIVESGDGRDYYVTWDDGVGGWYPQDDLKLFCAVGR